MAEKHNLNGGKMKQILTYPDPKSRLSSKISFLLCVSLMSAAFSCNTASIEKWTEIVLNAVATVGPLVTPLIGTIASLAGKTLTQSQVNAVNGYLNTAQLDLNAIDADLHGITGAPDQSTLGKINGLETAVSQSFNAALLQANGVSDAATQQNLVSSIQALIAIAQKLEAAIPTAIQPGQRPVMRRQMSEADFKVLAAQLKPSAIRASFNASIKPTGNADVDAAFDKALAK